MEISHLGLQIRENKGNGVSWFQNYECYSFAVRKTQVDFVTDDPWNIRVQP